MNFKFNLRDSFWFAVGGLMLGFGSRFALGCNLGAMYLSITNFSGAGWVFLLFMSLGGWVALRIMPGQVCTVGMLRKKQIQELKAKKKG